MKTFLSGVDIQDGQLHVRDITNGAGNIVTIDPTTRQFRERTTAQTLTDIGAEPLFAKGAIVQGNGISISGTLSSRLVGTGDLTISHLDTSSQATVTNSNGFIVQSVALDTYGHITSMSSLDGDSRWIRSLEVLNNQSVWSHVALTGGMDITGYTTGSSGYPTTLGLSVAFYAPTSDSTSGFGRAFAFTRGYNTRNYYIGSPNTSGVHNGWDLIYTSNNLTLSTLGGEPSFSKGSLIQGTNVTLSGTLSNRLVGSGDVTINVHGQVPVRQVFTYTSSNTFTLSNSNPTAIYVALNGQVLEQGALYDWTISGTTLTITTPLLSGDEISILYYTNLPSVTNYGRNIDGGSPDSVYLAIQNIDGGTP